MSADDRLARWWVNWETGTVAVNCILGPVIALSVNGIPRWAFAASGIGGLVGALVFIALRWAAARWAVRCVSQWATEQPSWTSRTFAWFACWNFLPISLLQLRRAFIHSVTRECYRNLVRFSLFLIVANAFGVVGTLVAFDHGPAGLLIAMIGVPVALWARRGGCSSSTRYDTPSRFPRVADKLARHACWSITDATLAVTLARWDSFGVSKRSTEVNMNRCRF